MPAHRRSAGRIAWVTAVPAKLRHRPELDSVERVTEFLAGNGHLSGVVVEGVDLTAADVDWNDADVSGAIFLACTFPPGDLAFSVQRRGAVVVPDLAEAGRPYRVYPPRLYDYAGLRAIDDATGAWFFEAGGPFAPDPVEAIAQRLHDTAMTDAMIELITRWDGRVVGIMGGHRVRRSEPEYEAVVRLARGLAERGYLVVTGGGPGVMEAGNLGAYLARAHDGEAAIAEAIAVLGEADEVDDLERYEAAAEEVHARQAQGSGGESLAVPTWHYPNEPVGRFASHIAKYFANSIREDGLLQIADAGVVFARGGAGTLQEVFQNGAINAYAIPGGQAPMVFLGEDAFGATSGIFATLCRSAAAKTTHTPYDHLLLLTEDVAEALAFIESPPPRPAAKQILLR